MFKNATHLVLSFALLIGFWVKPSFGAEDSVYEVSLSRDLTITGVSAAAGLVPYIFASSFITPKCPCLVSDIGSFDRGVVGNHSDGALAVSDVLLSAAVLGPVLGNYFAQGSLNDVFWEDFIVLSQALAISGALVSITKTIVQRPLPRAYEGLPGYVNDPRGYRSFFSGHAAITATALSVTAVTLSLRYSQDIWPWVGVAGVTTAVAALRILGGVHFYTDTIVGAAVGTTVGILVPLLHRRVSSSEKQSFMIVPQENGASALWSYRF